MPNWKKVIVSGSNAELNRLNVSTSFTSSGIHYPISDGLSGQFIQTDGLGNLTFRGIGDIISGSLFNYTGSFSGNVQLTEVPLGSSETNILLIDNSGSIVYRSNISLTGAQGFQGIAGVQGLQGSQGSQGNQGIQGTVGAQGFQGSQGIQGSTGISSGATYYLNQSTNSDVSPYKELSLTPSGSQQTVTINLTGSEQDALVSSFITSELGFAVIPGGVQRFHLHFLKPASNDNIDVYATIQLANSAGSPIGSIISTNTAALGWVSNVIPVEIVCDLVLPTTTIDPTNRMIVKLYLNNLDSTAHSVIWYTQGTSYYSFIVTSTGVIGNQGPQGTIGTQGTQGNQGAQGNQGSTGVQGFQGTNGTIGVDGAQGFQGFQGFQGTVGAQGTTGASAGIASYTNPADNRVITSVSSTEINAEANLTFDGSVLTVTGTITETSSAIVKENVESIINSLDTLKKLRGVQYNRIGNNNKEIGVIAEEVDEILPQIVTRDKNGNPNSVSYGRLTALLIEAIKELDNKINKLK